MMIGVLGRDYEGWGTQQIIASLEKSNVKAAFFSFPKLATRIGYNPVVSANNLDLVKDVSGIIVRSVGRGSLEEIILRMDMLHKLDRVGKFIVNHPRAIEKCVDKYYALALLKENSVPVPRTIVTEDIGEALVGFRELGGDVVLKPLFGSRGVGSTRIVDVDVAERIFRSVTFHHGVLYLQEFIEHGNSDIRVFIVGNRVVASMRRVGLSWKNNVSQGSSPSALVLSKDLEKLALHAAKAVGCKIAGVDMIEGSKGPVVIELNSQPGWRGLQSVTETNIADSIVEYVIDMVKR